MKASAISLLYVPGAATRPEVRDFLKQGTDKTTANRRDTNKCLGVWVRRRQVPARQWECQYRGFQFSVKVCEIVQVCLEP